MYDGSLDDTEIADFISANIEAAQKEYNSVVKKAPKISTDKARYLQEKKAYQEEVDKAKAKVDYWQAVENERQRITHTSPEELKNAEDELSGEAARKDYRGITAGDEENPTSVEDLVRDFLRGAKITPEDFRKETGLSISEQKKFVGMISKQGKTIARLGEELADYDEWNLGGRFFDGDSNAARGAIIDVLLSSRTRGDFKQQDATEEEEERYIEAVEQQREQWYYENYHMTYEEYLQYREIVLPELLRKYANFAPDILYPQFVASFEDAYAAEHSQTNNTENNEQQRNDTTAEEPTTTPGDTVLQTEEANNSRGDSQSKEQPTEVPTGVRSSNENGTLPQSTPTKVDKEPQPIGNSFFGKVYNQFKGKAKEAVNFLMRHKSGKLLGVFHRNDIGEISLVWGDEKGGLAHIISKHIVEQNDFNNIDEVINTMQQVINNGTITRENKDKVVIDYNDYRVAIRKQTRDNNGNIVEQGNWIVTAFDKSRSKKDKTPSEKTLSTPPFNQETDGVTLPSNGVTADKVTQSSQTKETKEDKFSPTPRKDGESITDYAERVAEEHQAQRTRKEEEAKVDTNPKEAARQQTTATLTNDTEAKQKATEAVLAALSKAGIEVVRATDEEVKALLSNSHATTLRTPQGTIYGWSVNGKIYLTEAGINPDTPIHEYTHLWAEAMMIKNKQGWNSIKSLLKDTPVWKEVIADPNYSSIKDNEDAVASEVLSRISGKKNAAKMEEEAQRAIDEAKGVFEKARATTILTNLKKALNSLWKWVSKNIFDVKEFSSINEVTDKVLYDLIHGTKLINDKSLIGVHNISEQKLRKVLKQGGFANPSIAVIDTDKQVHNDYGEISLILPSRKVNKSTGKNVGTYEGDAWTPMYPIIEKQMSSDGSLIMHNDINSVPNEMQSEVRNALNRWLDNGSDTDLSYLYLFQQGKAPKMATVKPKYSNEVYKSLRDIMFGVDSVYNLTKGEVKKLVELYVQTELNGDIDEYNKANERRIAKYKETIESGRTNSMYYKIAERNLEEVKKYGYPLSSLKTFADDVQRDKTKQGSKMYKRLLTQQVKL